MSVPCGRLHLHVTEELPDHREALAECQRPPSLQMTWAVNSHILQPGARTDAAPLLLQIGEVGPGRPARDDPGIVLLVGQVRLDGVGLGPERHDPSPVLASRGSMMSSLTYSHRRNWISGSRSAAAGGRRRPPRASQARPRGGPRPVARFPRVTGTALTCFPCKA